MEEFLWCGGWACCGLGAFALSCPLCLHSVFCAEAQLLGPVLLSLPVFASGGWAVSVGSALQWSAQRGNRRGTFGFGWWCRVRVHTFFFFLAWLICMLLAGSCHNRGCHLIKSIICWLNLLELRRKRSVHTFSSVGLFLFSLFSNSLAHSPMKYTPRKSIYLLIRDPAATAHL